MLTLQAAGKDMDDMERPLRKRQRSMENSRLYDMADSSSCSPLWTWLDNNKSGSDMDLRRESGDERGGSFWESVGKKCSRLNRVSNWNDHSDSLYCGDSYDHSSHLSPESPWQKKTIHEETNDSPLMSCPDYEELGYCVRGDYCHMKHGSDRIVCDALDMASILPSLPSKRLPDRIEQEHFPEIAIESDSEGTMGTPICTRAQEEDDAFASQMEENDEKIVESINNKNCIMDDESSTSRPVCPDYEHGYCLKGDSCPMLHGSDRIVVKDFQRLIELRLPPSLLSSSRGGSSLSGYEVEPSSWICQSGLSSTAVGLDIPTTVVSNKVAVYDPDEPHWEEEEMDIRKGKSVFFPDDRENLFLYNGNTRVVSTLDFEKSEIDDVLCGGLSQPRDEGIDRFDCESEACTLMENNQASGANLKGDRIAALTCANMDSLAASKPKRARSSLYVSAIPEAINRKELLLGHFQKFGKILDIHTIPKAGTAFVQFCRRGDAEAALDSQDAVLGNRFIRILWANRDNIQDPGEDNCSQVGQKMRSSAFGVRRESAAVTLQPIEKVGKKLGSLNGKKWTSYSSPPPLAKREDQIELMKEQIRQKQMELEKKRDDLKCRLDSLTNRYFSRERQEMN